MTREETLKIIRKFQQSPPVDVSAIANHFGLRVWESAKLGMEISGKLFRDPINGGSAQFSLVVNSAEPFIRKRFTVAHELAHFILHRDQIGEGIAEDVYYRGGLRSRFEAEANRLAADILIPEDLLNRYTATFNNDPAVLARLFQVSQTAMSIVMDFRSEAVSLV